MIPVVGALSAQYNVRDSKTPGGPSAYRTDFDVPIGEHPDSVDLRDRLPPCYDQGQLGSCTANALAAAIQFDRPDLMPRRLFIYYNERTIENDVADDGGACLADGVKAAREQGVCSEDSWPYSDDKEQFKNRPPDSCYEEARNNMAVGFENVLLDHDHLKAALASGFPIAMGIKLYEGFESQDVKSNGQVPMPRPSSEKCLGGHAVLMVGYNEASQQWIFRNSWGPSWGDGGYFYLPYAYICDQHLGTDPWVIQRMS